MDLDDNIVFSIPEMFERHVRYNFRDDVQILALVSGQSPDEKLDTLAVIASIGRDLIESRIAGGTCRHPNCGSLAMFLRRALDNAKDIARGDFGDLHFLASQLQVADQNAGAMALEMDRQVLNLSSCRKWSHFGYIAALVFAFWVVFIEKCWGLFTILGKRGVEAMELGENFAPTLFTGFQHCVERHVAKKGTVLNETVESLFWIQRIARLTSHVIWGCARGPPPRRRPPPPRRAPPNPTPHMNVQASSSPSTNQDLGNVTPVTITPAPPNPNVQASSSPTTNQGLGNITPGTSTPGTTGKRISSKTTPRGTQSRSSGLRSVVRSHSLPRRPPFR